MSHATLSPSGRARWSKCAASVKESLKYPNVSGAAAIDGTHTHTVLSDCIDRQIWDANKLVGERLMDHEGDFKVDQARAERVNVALDYVKRRIEELGPHVEVLSERKVNPAPLVGRGDMKGTADIQIVGDSTYELIDYKDGMGVVEVYRNPQLSQYGVGGLAEHTEQPFKTIRLTIIQPKLALKGMSAVSYSDEDASTFLEREVAALKAEGAATDVDSPAYTPGNAQCQYCPAKGNCSAFANFAMEKSGMEIGPIELANDAASKNPAEMDAESLSKILEAAPLLRQLIEAAEKEALSRIQAGQAVPGFKVVNGRGARKWAHDDDTMAEKLRKMGIPKGSVYVTKVVSPAQAEKITWTKRDGSKEQLSKRQLDRIDKEYIVTMGGKPTLAPESDHRASIVNDVSSMFGSATPAPAIEAAPDWMK